jgi:hypothetical protein
LPPRRDDGACRALPGSIARRIYSMEVVSSTEWCPSEGFAPTRFVDVSNTMATKHLALQAYASELRTFPYPRSCEAIEALVRWRGVSAGLAAAEAFMVLRDIEG